ncbi:MAG: PqqD family peptide modification chaperone [Acidimicrobiia bacterium]
MSASKQATEGRDSVSLRPDLGAIAYRSLGDETLVLDVRRGCVLTLTGASRLAFDAMLGGATEHELALRLRRAYAIEAERAVVDTARFVGELRARGWLEPSGPSPATDLCGLPKAKPWPRAGLSEPAQWLLDAVYSCSDDRGTRAGAPDADAVLRLAAHHRVLPIAVSHLLARSDTPDVCLAAAHRAGRVEAEQAFRSLTDLRLIATVLADIEGGWMLIKGAALERAIRPPKLPRQAGDLDVLVERHAFGDALAALEASGARLVTRNWGLLYRDHRKAVVLQAPAGTLIDLHWSLVPTGAAAGAVGPEALAPHRRRMIIGGTTVHTLGPLATAVHTLSHAGGHGGNTLGWMVDCALALRSVGACWTALAALAEGWGVSMVTAGMLGRLRRLHPDLVPAIAVETVAMRAGWPSALRRAWLAAFVRSDWALIDRGRGSVAAVLGLHTHDRGLETIRSLASFGGRYARRGGPCRDHVEHYRLDASDARSDFYDDPSQRAAYVRWVQE